MPANILNLPAYTITAIDETEHDYHIKAESVNPPKHCLNCGVIGPVGFGRGEQLVRDLPMHGKRVALYINTRRMKCHVCGKTFSENLPGVDEKRAMTQRLLEW